MVCGGCRVGVIILLLWLVLLPVVLVSTYERLLVTKERNEKKKKLTNGPRDVIDVSWAFFLLLLLLLLLLCCPVLVLVICCRSGLLHPTKPLHEQGLMAVAGWGSSSSALVTLVSNNKMKKEERKTYIKPKKCRSHFLGPCFGLLGGGPPHLVVLQVVVGASQ